MQVIELDARGSRSTRALIFETGDPVIATLEEYARRQNIRAARFSALGAFRRASLAYFEWESRAYQELPVAEQVEVTALVGDIGFDGQDVVVHAHCVLGHADGSAITGHLLEAEVRPTLELFLDVYDATLGRSDDEESGLALIRADARAAG